MRRDRKRSRERSRSPRRRSPERSHRSRAHSNQPTFPAAPSPFFDPAFFAHMQAMLAASTAAQQKMPYAPAGDNLAAFQQMGAQMAQLLSQQMAPASVPTFPTEPPTKRDWIPLYIRHGNGSVNPRNDNMVVFEGPEAEQIIPRAVKLFSINATTRVKNIAASIAHTCRRCAAPVLLAVGEEPINLAVKGASIARDFLAQDQPAAIMDLAVQPEFRSEGGLYLILFKTAFGEELPRTIPALAGAEFLRSEEDDERGKTRLAQEGVVKCGKEVIDATDFLRVAHGSDPHIVAGAIAKKIRRSDSVDLLAIGGAAVNVAVKAIAYARMYLVENCVNLRYVSSFVNIALESEGRSGIRFMLCPKLVNPQFPTPRILKARKEAEEKASGKKRTTGNIAEEDTAASQSDEETKEVKRRGSPSPKKKEKEDPKRRQRDRSASVSSVSD